MYTFDQVLWVRPGKPAEYCVKNAGKFMLYEWRRIDSLGKLAARYRHQGEKAVKEKLPNLPVEVWDSIVAIAAYQDTWMERQRQKEAEEEEFAKIGKWD